MSAAVRHWFAAAAAAWLMAGTLAAGAQEARLHADCGAPQAVGTAEAPKGNEAARGTTTISCEVRATEPVAFKDVRATLRGRTEALETQFAAFDGRSQSLSVLFLIQIMEPSRRAVASEMLEAVVKLAETRDGKRRYAAYSVGNDLNFVADFNASKADFDRQVRAIRTIKLTTQLYKNALEAIAKLAKEDAERRVLVILGDGSSDDPTAGYNHDIVVRAARDARVTIHALGYFGETADLPQFQVPQRLADATGGFRREVRVGSQQRYTIPNSFFAEVIENGGTAKVTLKEPAGPSAITLTGDFANGKSASVDQSLTVPTPAVTATPQKQAPPLPPQALPPQTWYQALGSWARNNMALAVVLGTALSLGLVGMVLFGLSHRNWQGEEASAGTGEPLLDAQGRAVVYAWLDMMDGNASRYPLKMTNVRIGRHRDNDICLQNDSISRRHAVLHFDANNRRFIITDLGGGNGVIVNKVKQPSHDLSDGDLVELGEVRLRFRTNAEVMK